MQHQEFFEYLMKQGLVYRYSQERFSELAGGGQPYPSSTREVIINGKPFVEELIQPVLSPVILSREEIVKLERVTHVFGKFLKAQFEFFRKVKNGEINGFVSSLVRQMCTDNEWQFGLLDAGYEEILPFVRLDCLRTKDGFIVVDINSTRPAGVGDCILLSPAYKKFGFEGKPLPTEEYFVNTVKVCYEQWTSRKKVGKHLWDILVKGSDGDWSNFKALLECLSRAGFFARLVEDIDESSDLIIRSRIKEGDPLFIRLNSLYPDKVCVISPLYRRFLGNKLWMYLIHLPQVQEFFATEMGREDFEFLKSLFPQVGIMDGNFICFANGEKVELTAKNRKEWVVKTPAGSSASGMIFGLMSEDRWRALMSFDHTGAIVQQFHRSMEKLPVVSKGGEVVEEKLYTKYGVFILGGKFAGCEVMARRHHIVHGARNTYFSCCFKE